MKRFSDLPIYFIIIGLVLNIALSIHAKVSFTELMFRSIVVIILFTIMGFILASILRSASSNIRKNRIKKKMEVKEEVTTSSTFDIKVDSDDEDELLRTLYRQEDDDDAIFGSRSPHKGEDEEFVEINPENFKRFMDQD